MAFIGLNGSGKSQLLELIAEIFAYLEREKRRDFKVRKPLSFKFLIEFRNGEEINRVSQKKYRVELQDRRKLVARVFCDNLWQDFVFKNIPLPDFVIGYASGLNENLQRAFLKNAVQYLDVMSVRASRRKQLAGQIDEDRVEEINQNFIRRFPRIYSELDPQGRPSFIERDTAIPGVIFLDYDCSALLMVSLALMPDTALSELFPNIPFHLPRRFILQYDFRDAHVEEDAIKDIQQLIRLLGENLYGNRELTPSDSSEYEENPQKYIYKLGETSIKGLCRKTNDAEYDIYELTYLSANITIDLELPGLKEKLNVAYGGQPYNFFQKLYKVQLLGAGSWQANDKKNLRNDAFFGNVKKPLKTKLPLSVVELKLSNGESLVDFDDLSDGEAQLIQVLGAARIFRDKSTLFLFDEPETHLNPSWRTNFHLYLTHALIGEDNAHVVLSTHSPFLISSLYKRNVFRFIRNNYHTVMHSVESETFGASFDSLIKEYFELTSTISQTAVDAILLRLNNQKLSDSDRRKWIDENVGDSMEKSYLLRKLGN